MRIEAATQENIAFGLEPCAPLLVAVTAHDNMTLHVEFSDGLQGDVKFLPTHFTGVFEPLKNSNFFAQVRVEYGAVTWPGELDLAPDAMYDAIKRNGIWILQ
jgi:Protein of unknown function (DUF2442)